MWFTLAVIMVSAASVALYLLLTIAKFPPRAAAPTRMCKRKGCSKRAFRQHEFCSKTCYTYSLAATARPCARPGCPKTAFVSERNVSVRYDYCAKRCFHKHSDGVLQTTLVFLSPDSFDYQNVSKKVHGALNITKIARIIYPTNLAKVHRTSATHMAASLKFHGTRLACDSVCKLGTPCLISTCSICCILRGGFQAGFVRRGPGFFFAPDAATSTTYCVANAKGMKAMFLCSVYEAVVTKAISSHTDTKVVLPRFLIYYR